ncbi:hypothetical protein RRG08_028926 [Elysia crispata]|uniref:Secreted protein n=1 Tax=Elysia crispata TaxID=231223 RepID=A0AAE1AQ12_9GAST|nr:hypothetical protein RRG08_028926 [Elysia crispata]
MLKRFPGNLFMFAVTMLVCVRWSGRQRCMNPLRCYRPTPSMAAKVGHQFHPPEGAIHRVQSTSALRIPKQKKTFWQSVSLSVVGSNLANTYESKVLLITLRLDRSPDQSRKLTAAADAILPFMKCNNHTSSERVENWWVHSLWVGQRRKGGRVRVWKSHRSCGQGWTDTYPTLRSKRCHLVNLWNIPVRKGVIDVKVSISLAVTCEHYMAVWPAYVDAELAC